MTKHKAFGYSAKCLESCTGDFIEGLEYRVVGEGDTGVGGEISIIDEGGVVRNVVWRGFLWKFERTEVPVAIHRPEQEEEPMTIEQLLTKANKHAAKAQKHEAKRQALIEQARALMPEGWRLEDSGLVVQTTEDMTDPANWKAGDVVECISDVLNVFSKGSKYTLASEADSENGEDWMVTIRKDDEGDECHAECTYFRWISRPQ